MEPSIEVKDLLGRANRHYALGEPDQAIELLTEVVRIEPALRVPWYTLATIHEEKGDLEKAVGFKMIAAHLMSVAKAAVEWASLGAQSRCVDGCSWLLLALVLTRRANHAGTSASCSKLSTATRRLSRETRKTLTRCGIAPSCSRCRAAPTSLVAVPLPSPPSLTFDTSFAGYDGFHRLAQHPPT